MTVDTSRSLLGRIVQGDSDDSWQIFVSIYHPFILRCIAARQVPARDRDDLCQETLTCVFKGVSGFQHNGRPGAFRTWLVTIVSQRVWNYFQDHARNDAVARAAREHVASGYDSFRSELDHQWEQEHDRHVVERLLELVRPEFSPSSWQAFRRVVLDGQSASSVAGELGMSVNAVLIAKSRIMRRLKEIGAGMVNVLDLSENPGTER